jgi:hypothetical protein
MRYTFINMRKILKKPTLTQVARLLVVLACVIASIMLLKAAKPLADKPCVTKDMYCYGRTYALLTFNKSPTDAFTAMKADYKTDTFVSSQCHQLSHIIGRTAYNKYLDLPKVFANGDSFCWSGYYHGVVEQAVGTLGSAKIKEQLNNLCSSFAEKQRYSFDHFNCVHGLGHGLMTVESFDLLKALESCGILKDAWDKSSCQGGVYMENVMVASRENGHSEFLKPNDLLYPCNAVAKDFKQQCYLMQTSYILQQNKYNYTETFKLCSQADEGFSDTCYQSIGRDASGSSTNQVKLTASKCRLAADGAQQYNCMIGAVKDFVSYYHSDVQANELCLEFGESTNEACREIVRSYYANF